MDEMSLLGAVALGISGLASGLYLGLTFRKRTTIERMVDTTECAHAEYRKLHEAASQLLGYVRHQQREVECLHKEIERNRQQLGRMMQLKAKVASMDYFAEEIDAWLKEMTPSYIPDEAWERWKKSLGEAEHDRQQTEELAHKLWQEAGSPEGRQDHFWDMAEQQITKRILGEKGVSGACMTDKELAKQKAIEQFIRRRKAAIRDGQIDNSSLHAGMPMIFYCKCCGIMVETLPEDYLFSARKRCSQCKGLAEMNWLDKAVQAAAQAGLELPTPKRWVPNEARKEDSEVAQ